MAFTFITVFLLLADYTESANRSGDLVVQYYDQNSSIVDLLTRRNITYAPFDVRNIKCPYLEYSCQSVCPLANEDQERIDEKACYCDRLCIELGDCCYDYFSRFLVAQAEG